MTYNFFDRPILVISMAALTLMTCVNAPAFIWFFCFILWTHKWLSSKNLSKIPLKPIGRKLTTLFAVVIFFVILFQYRSIFVQEAASSLLVALTAVKVLDYSNKRDHLIVILLGFLLLTLKPLFGLELIWLPLQLICVVGLFWSLTADPEPIPRRLFLSILAASLPFSLALFLLFPRVVLPWAISQGKFGKSAKVGFTTELTPGRFSELADSNEIAFRAVFPEGSYIDAKELYWRGAVLKKSNGLIWEKKPDEILPKSKYPNADSSFDYEIISEAANGVYVFTLDSTFKIQSDQIKPLQLKNQIWRLTATNMGTQRIKASAAWAFHDSTPPTKDDLQTTKLSPKASMWVKETINTHPSLQARRTALRELFTNSSFTYTQNPGSYNTDALDEFIFERRRGFCEHFAGAYATLARALNIPARVISGYQGGDFNPVGKFWRVTQRYAHAWVEVWDGEIWQRVDPTIWATIFEFNRDREKQWSDWISESLDIYENVNYRWTSFLLDFDQNVQLNIFKEYLPQLIVVVLLALAGIFVFKVLYGWIMTPKKERIVNQKHMLSRLIEEIRKDLELSLQKNCGSLTPMQVIGYAKTELYGPEIFYQNLSQYYDQIFYQELFEENMIEQEIRYFQKKWVEIQLLRK